MIEREQFFKDHPDDAQRRFGYLEGRKDLLETKVLRIGPDEQFANESTRKEVLFVCRDPSSGNTLVPVMESMSRNKDIEMMVITDGRAQEIIQKKFTTSDVTPRPLALGADKVIGKPEVVVAVESVEKGLETYSAATFTEVPIILIEDYHAASFELIEALKERELPLPNKICVIDEYAGELLKKRFPEIADRIEVTGLPVYDRFSRERTLEIAQAVRARLGLNPDDKLVTFMSSCDTPELVEGMAKQLHGLAQEFRFAFRKHPRDNVPYTEYYRILREAGLQVIEVENFSTDEISAASDIVLTTWSTEGIHAIFRRKSTIHITDSRFPNQEGRTPPILPLPPVRLGASTGVERVEELADALRHFWILQALLM